MFVLTDRTALAKGNFSTDWIFTLDHMHLVTLGRPILLLVLGMSFQRLHGHHNRLLHLGRYDCPREDRCF